MQYKPQDYLTYNYYSCTVAMVTGNYYYLVFEKQKHYHYIFR